MVVNSKLVKHFENLENIFGESLPNPEQEPHRFSYYVKLYRYFDNELYMKVENESSE